MSTSAPVAPVASRRRAPAARLQVPTSPLHGEAWAREGEDDVSSAEHEVGIAIAMVADGVATRIRLCGLLGPAAAAKALAASAAAVGVSVSLRPGAGSGLEIVVARA
jgi:hypothetical protein